MPFKNNVHTNLDMRQFLFSTFITLVNYFLNNEKPEIASLNTAPANLIKNVIFCYLLTPQNRVFLEKLTSSQLVKKIFTFYGT